MTDKVLEVNPSGDGAWISTQPFGVRFKEAIDVMKGKLPEATNAWDDLAGPVHSKVFAVAGATKIDLVADLHDAVTQAIEQGQSLGDFRKRFDKAVAKHGWTYRGSRGWRSSLIYDVNMRSAHMAGRWQQLVANADRKPYLQYRTAGDSRVRPLHRQWDGLVYPINDAFWDTHYPPNDYRCRCTVRAYSYGDLVDQGLTESAPYSGPSRWVTNKDGVVTDVVPLGIGPGWDHNVGKSWLGPEVALGQKIARLPIWLQGQMAEKAVSPAFQKVIEDNFKGFQQAIKTDVSRGVPRPRGDVQLLGFLDSMVINQLAAQVPTFKLESTALLHRDANQTHIEGHHKNKPRTGKRRGGSPQQVWPQDFIDKLPSHLRNYRVVLWDVEDQALIVVPDEQFNATVPTAAFKQRKTKLGVAWELKGLGSKEAQTLKDQKKYLPLAGTLK